MGNIKSSRDVLFPPVQLSFHLHLIPKITLFQKTLMSLKFQQLHHHHKTHHSLIPTSPSSPSSTYHSLFLSISGNKRISSITAITYKLQPKSNISVVHISFNFWYKLQERQYIGAPSGFIQPTAVDSSPNHQLKLCLGSVSAKRNIFRSISVCKEKEKLKQKRAEGDVYVFEEKNIRLWQTTASIVGSSQKIARSAGRGPECVQGLARAYSRQEGEEDGGEMRKKFIEN